jgi:hypothetical protein
MRARSLSALEITRPMKPECARLHPLVADSVQSFPFPVQARAARPAARGLAGLGALGGSGGWLGELVMIIE